MTTAAIDFKTLNDLVLGVLKSNTSRSEQVTDLRKAIAESREIAQGLAQASGHRIQAIDKGEFGMIWQPRELFSFLDSWIKTYKDETLVKAAYGLVERALNNLKTRIRGLVDLGLEIQGKKLGESFTVENIEFGNTAIDPKKYAVNYWAEFKDDDVKIYSSKELASAKEGSYPITNPGKWHVNSMIDHTELKSYDGVGPMFVAETGLKNNDNKGGLVPHTKIYAHANGHRTYHADEALFEKEPAFEHLRTLDEKDTRETSDYYLPSLF